MKGIPTNFTAIFKEHLICVEDGVDLAQFLLIALFSKTTGSLSQRNLELYNF